jgi:hypothetical protein
MHRCLVAAWEGWTTNVTFNEDFERAAAGNCRAAQSYSATERRNRAPSQTSSWLVTSRREQVKQVKRISLFAVGAFCSER